MITQQQQPTQAELRDQIREQVRKSMEDARAQIKAAEKQLEKSQATQTSVKLERVTTPTAPLPPLEPLPALTPATPLVVEQPDHGMYIGVPSERLDDIPPRAQELGMMFLITMAVIIIGFPIARAIGRLIDRRSAAPALRGADLQPQLLRIEQAVEAMSIEIERISESQRYLTRLQAGREEEVLIPRRTGK